jgi:hypothetical protein
MIVVFGDRVYRYDIPNSKIIALAIANVIADMDFPRIFNHKVDGIAPMPNV